MARRAFRRSSSSPRPAMRWLDNTVSDTESLFGGGTTSVVVIQSGIGTDRLRFISPTIRRIRGNIWIESNDAAHSRFFMGIMLSEPGVAISPLLDEDRPWMWNWYGGAMGVTAASSDLVRIPVDVKAMRKWDQEQDLGLHIRVESAAVSAPAIRHSFRVLLAEGTR